MYQLSTQFSLNQQLIHLKLRPSLPLCQSLSLRIIPQIMSLTDRIIANNERIHLQNPPRLSPFLPNYLITRDPIIRNLQRKKEEEILWTYYESQSLLKYLEEVFERVKVRWKDRDPNFHMDTIPYFKDLKVLDYDVFPTLQSHDREILDIIYDELIGYLENIQVSGKQEEQARVFYCKHLTSRKCYELRVNRDLEKIQIMFFDIALIIQIRRLDDCCKFAERSLVMKKSHLKVANSSDMTNEFSLCHRKKFRFLFELKRNNFLKLSDLLANFFLGSFRKTLKYQML